MGPAWHAGGISQRIEDRANLADAGNGTSERVWNLAFDEHLDPQRDHAQHPSEVEAGDLERHEGLIEPSLAFNDVGEAGDVPGPGGRTFRLRETTTKYLLKQAMRGILPDSIIDRPKHGFAVPLARWFRGELAGFARDILLSDRCRQRGFFDVGYIERLLRLNQRGRDLDLHLWTILSFELWCRRFLDASTVSSCVTAKDARHAERTQSHIIFGTPVATGPSASSATSAMGS